MAATEGEFFRAREEIKNKLYEMAVDKNLSPIQTLRILSYITNDLAEGLLEYDRVKE